MITKEEWLDWKNNPVTQYFYDACVERIDDAMKILAATAGQDQINDNFNRGFLYAYQEMLEFRVDEVVDEG